jgi:hypothetical protein
VKDTQQPKAKAKAKWQRPRIVYREPLEAIAAACSPPGKANSGACPSGPIGS